MPHGPNPDELPNVVLITVDCLRPDHLGLGGYVKPTSPHLDALAESAHVFETCWACGPNTPVSFPGIMASCLPFKLPRAGMQDVPLTLAGMLRRRGYHTRGFNCGNAYLTHYFGYDRGFDELDEFMGYQPDPRPLRYLRDIGPTGRSAGRGRRTLQRALDKVNDIVGAVPPLARCAEALEPLWRPVVSGTWHANRMRFKQEREEAFWPRVVDWARRGPPEPFFLWVHAMTVHEPYCPPAEHQRAVDGTALSHRRTVRARRIASELNQGRRKELDPRVLSDLIHLYDAEVHQVDERIGAVFGALRSSDRLDSSIVIVTADHGEQFAEHGRLLHLASHYNEQLRVPLLIRLPGQRAKRGVRTQVGLIDLLPTLADLLGERLEPELCEGSSFLPLLCGQNDRARESRVYISESFYGSHDVAHTADWRHVHRAPRRLSFQNAGLKLMADCAGARRSAFNLRNDPGELRNLVDGNAELDRLVADWTRLHLRRSERIRLLRATGAPGLPS